ncbi:MAG: succinylglutamate desuccinylase/aspartoacylase family protein [Alphaproteobacteria bacterium]|nr:succinylglutamate desuccinylase/aspartoacylase family protein [Alphaproteobacteria bacterium]
MIEPVVYTASTPGPRFLVIGAVHGNEKCGTAAIRRLIGDIDSGTVKIARGRVTFVPIANPRAYEADVRFTERNLNRYLGRMEKPDTYEARIGNVLCPLLEDCDVLLDIHSYTVGGAPFILANQGDAKGFDFARNLGGYTIMTGWAEAYAHSGRRKETSDEESTGTTEYARKFGAAALTIECGQHKDPQAPEVAYQAIRNALRYLNMVDEPSMARPAPSGSLLVTLTQVFYRDDEGHFPKNWKNLEPVTKGETLAFHADGRPIPAPANGVIVMPRADTPLGEEWFYFGVATK